MSSKKSITKIKLGMIAAMPFPPHKASGIRVNNQIEILKKNAAIRLYCAPPGRGRERADGFLIFRSQTKLDTSSYYKYYSWKKKISVDFQLAKMVATDIKSNKINIIHAQTPEGVFISFIARFFAWSWIPVVGDMHGPFLPELVHYKMIPDNFLAKGLFSLFERLLYASVRKLIPTSNGLAEYLSQKASKKKIEVFSDYVVLKKFRIPKIDIELRKIINPKKRTIVMYAGTLKDYQGLDILTRAAKKVLDQYQNIQFVILGDGGLGKEHYQKRTERLGISDHFTFIGMVPHSHVARYLVLADILVSPRLDTEVTRGGFVSQMPEYMAMGKMIVATKVSDCGKMLDQGAGILVRPNSSLAFAQGLIKAIEDKKHWAKYISQAQTNLRDFSWEGNSDRLINLYSILLSGKQGKVENSDGYETPDEHGNVELSLKYFKKFNPRRSAKILDIGANIGSFLNKIHSFGYYNILGLDIRNHSIEFGKSKYTRIKNNLICYDGKKIPASDNKFDVVTMFDVIEHVPQVERFIKKEVLRVLKPGGLFIFQTPNRYINSIWETISARSLTSWKVDHCSLQSLGSLRKLLKNAGFNEIVCEKFVIDSEFNKQKLQRRFGNLARIIVWIASKMPLSMAPNFWGYAIKKDQ